MPVQIFLALSPHFLHERLEHHRVHVGPNIDAFAVAIVEHNESSLRGAPVFHQLVSLTADFGGIAGRKGGVKSQMQRFVSAIRGLLAMLSRGHVTKSKYLASNFVKSAWFRLAFWALRFKFDIPLLR